MKLLHQIAAIPFFRGLSREELEDLAMIVVDQTFKKGQTIFSEGEEGSGFHVVISGRVKIFKISPEGKEQILHLMEPGEPFGEAAVFSGDKFPAHAQTLEVSRIFFFPRPAFIDLIKKNPHLALNMLAVLSRRLRKFTALVEDLSLKEVPGRLAAYFLYLGERKKGTPGTDDLALDISKSQLASLLGTIPETLSRILSRMIREGLIRSEAPGAFGSWTAKPSGSWRRGNDGWCRKGSRISAFRTACSKFPSREADPEAKGNFNAKAGLAFPG